MKQGTFITFEGIDGVGKSTQLDLVYQKCLQLGHPVVKTREPGGTELGRGIRRLLLNPGLKNLGAQAELLLYAADRAQHVAEVIVPALKAGKVVLCDRYLDSTVAYQGYGLGRDPVLVRQINELAVEGVLPQLTLCLDEELERALKRTKGDRIEQRDLEYYHRVRNGYHQIARAEPERFFLIDASGTIDQVFEKIWSVIAERGIL
ncbi:MAG: dTMP kinase [Firmicutes bacterium]|jgi:dTMP kinase|nr:dTMP kinase [Bacillota bacterium]NLL89100.1 dTMP kinase [Bacillota bacterium]HKM17928.1 dTMP kinase [Limnochordia bacterium]